jgi:hypothetical protein
MTGGEVLAIVFGLAWLVIGGLLVIRSAGSTMERPVILTCLDLIGGLMLIMVGATIVTWGVL